MLDAIHSNCSSVAELHNLGQERGPLSMPLATTGFTCIDSRHKTWDRQPSLPPPSQRKARF